jgi:two-component system, sensor histidine kinase YesM
MKKFHNLKLSQKLLLSYFILIIIPLGIFTVFSYNTVYSILEKHIVFSATRSFDQTSEYLLYKINKIIKVSDVIIADNTLNQVLEKKLESYGLPEQYKDMSDLRQYLDSFIDKEDVRIVRLFVRDEFTYSRGSENISGISSAMESLWYRKLTKSGAKVLMCPPAYLEQPEDGQQKTLSVVRKMVSSSDYSQIIGFLRVDFLEKDILSIISNANTVNGSLTYICNSEDLPVSATSSALLKKYRLGQSLIEELSNAGKWNTRTVGGEEVYVKIKTIPNTDWIIITVIPYNEIFSDISTLRNIMFLLMIIIGTVAYISAVYLTLSITKRVARLIRRMKAVQNGSLDNVTIQSDSTDEIGELTDNFNYMIHRISDLVEEQYLSGQELKNAELKALQAQINPHFLYNTLDMINWMSYDDKGTEIRVLVKALSTFYKLSLNKGKDIVSIRDELLHVSLYVQIQNVRMKNSVNFEIALEEAIYDYGILKITLQPIVENAILHGIMEGPAKSGTISISGKLENGSIILAVKDDGKGIPQETISNILSGNHKSKHGSGFGIRNIHDRIGLFFGPQYGISISSEPGNGTAVTITIPAVNL